MESEELKYILKENDYYKILSVDKVSTSEEIRKAYKKLAVKYHPDKNKHIKAPDAFKKISHAFTVLSDQQKRSTYDKFGNEEGPVNNHHSSHFHFSREEFDPFDIFKQMFENDGFGGFGFGGGQGNSFKVYTSGDGTTMFTSFSNFGGGNRSSRNNIQYFNEEDDEESENEEEEEEEEYVKINGKLYRKKKDQNKNRNRSQFRTQEDILNDMLFGRRNQNTSNTRFTTVNHNQRNRPNMQNAITYMNLCLKLLIYIPIIFIVITYLIPRV